MSKWCKRCGKCCIIFDTNINKWIDCKYLRSITGAQKLTYCEIYKTRNGKDLGFNFSCQKRSKLKFNIPGCAYNQKHLNIHPAYK